MKTLGLSLIFVCCVSIGIFNSRKAHDSVKQLKEILSFMEYTKNKITYFNSTLDDIYTNYEFQDPTIGSLIQKINLNGWKHSFESTEGICIPTNTISKILQYGQTLGKSNKDEQKTHIEHYIELITKDLKLLEEKAPEKSKLSIALGVFSGLMIVIIFI